jgi:hypothetical protein
MGKKHDNKERDLKLNHMFSKDSGYKRRSDIKEVNITEFMV